MSAAAAYRKDVEKRSGPIGKDDGAWIVVATMVSQIAHARGPGRRRLLDQASELAAKMFDGQALAYGCTFDPSSVDPESPIAKLRLLAERIEHRGALNTADVLLDGLARVTSSPGKNAGRLLAQRARIAFKSGDNELSVARFQYVRRMSYELRSNELLVRSWLGFAAGAQARGNLPELREWSQRIVDRSDRCGFARLSAGGYMGLMVTAAEAGRLDEAMEHAWRVYSIRKDSPIGKIDALTNMGRLLLVSGNAADAQRAFLHVLSNRPPVHAGCIALGGYALASSRLQDARSVRWAAAEAIVISDLGTFGMESASTLLDCANALDAIDESAHADVLRARASTIAQYGGYHEIVHRLSERAKPAQPPVVQYQPPAAMLTDLPELTTAQLPEHLELVEV